MHKIGENQGLSKVEQQQVLREILQIVEGSVPVDVTRAGSTSMDREILKTSNMFFICFGVFEAEEQLLNQDLELEGEEYEDDFEVIHDEDEEEDIKILREPNNNNFGEGLEEKDLTERRDSRTSNISMDTTVSSSSNSSGRNSNSSSEKSPEINVKRRNSNGLNNNNTSNNNNNNNLKTTEKLTRRKDEFTCTKKLTNHNNKNKAVVKSEESDLSSVASSQDEWDDWYNSCDDSFQGLKENKLARMVTEAENSPIPHYQTLWGMKDVDLKFNPEALEIIANQVKCHLYLTRRKRWLKWRANLFWTEVWIFGMKI